MVDTSTLSRSLPHRNHGTPLDHPHPNRTSLANVHGCNFSSTHPILRHSDTHRATSHITLNRITGRFLRRTFNVHAITRIITLNNIRADPSLPLPAPSSLRTLSTSPIHALSGKTRSHVVRHVSRTGGTTSALNNIVRMLTCNIPTNVNACIRSSHHLSTTLTSTVVKVRTFGNIRVNSNFLRTTHPNSRTRSRVIIGTSNHVSQLSGHTNNVRNNVSGNRIVHMHNTVGPVPSVPGTLHAISILANRSTTTVGRHSSDATIPTTSIITRTVIHLALTGCTLRGFNNSDIRRARHGLRTCLTS